MGRFLKRLAVFLSVPLLLLAAVYITTDPYRTLRPFSLTYFDSVNRDYLSSELFAWNYPEQQYNSYVFGSSRGCGINTYQWLKYLPEGSKQFLFQAWSETITGIDQKVTYIDDHHYPLDNAIVLIDIPGSFSYPQLSNRALSLKDPRFSHQPRWMHQSILFYDFIQKPSQWGRAVRSWIRKIPPEVSFDPVMNDWEMGNREMDLDCPPEQDSLKGLSRIAKAVFLKEYGDNPEVSLPKGKPVIDARMTGILQHIKDVFDRNGTDYRIIVTPAYGYQFPAITDTDLRVLEAVFGANAVFDFSGREDITLDYNNFSDPSHFGLRVGWQILNEVYGSEHDDAMSPAVNP